MAPRVNATSPLNSDDCNIWHKLYKAECPKWVPIKFFEILHASTQCTSRLTILLSKQTKENNPIKMMKITMWWKRQKNDEKIKTSDGKVTKSDETNKTSNEATIN